MKIQQKSQSPKKKKEVAFLTNGPSGRIGGLKSLLKNL